MNEFFQVKIEKQIHTPAGALKTSIITKTLQRLSDFGSFLNMLSQQQTDKTPHGVRRFQKVNGGF